MQAEEILSRAREVFRIEAEELLRELETALLALESAPSDTALIDRVFRAMHTLKGSGATSGFQELSGFLHHVEDVFNAARDGRIPVTAGIVDLTLRLCDAVSRHLAAPAAEAPAALEAARPDLEALLRHLPAKKPASAAPQPAQAAPSAAADTYRIHFRPGADAFRSGFDPGMFLDDLRALGPCSLQPDLSRLPPLAEMDPESNYLGWEIELRTAYGIEAVRAVFLFIEGECELEITALPAAPAPVHTWFVRFEATAATLAAPGALDGLWRDLDGAGRRHIESQPSHPGMPGTWIFRYETASPQDKVLESFIFLPDARPEVRSEPFAAEAPAPVAAAAAPQAAPAAPARGPLKAAAAETLRVSAERLDQLVNLVGELVILRAQVSNACGSLSTVPPELQSAAEALQTLSGEMRDVVLNLRMTPIEQTFSKFNRLVRDLSRDLGKSVDLAIEGGETEMDKTMLDALADPLVHLVRNSLDHGLETPAERAAAGKPERGTLRLKASQQGDRVVVSVSDDGRGLDAERIRRKAAARGLIAADARPSDAELFQLIFLPGFSTADQVSQVSGRGVGLDVVRRQVEQLRGRVEVRSVAGRGAEFRLSLPLTLAIIEGLMVEVDGDRFVLPLSIAHETIELPRARRDAGNGRNIVDLRGELVPYLRLRDLFGFSGEAPDPERVIIVELEERRLGLVVDRVIGNHQTVLKSLGWLGHRVSIFSGATVLGDGRVALILDVPALVAHQARGESRSIGLEV